MAAHISKDSGTETRGWQPVTFGGAAALARTTAARLFAVGMVAAGLMAAAVARTFCVGWMPVIETAIRSLPVRASIVDRKFLWPTNAPVRLADNSFLAIAASSDTSSGLTGADVVLEFTKNGLRTTSLLGSAFVPYPPGLSVSLDPVSLMAGWLAWKPHIVVGVFLAAFAFVWIAWITTGLALAPFLRLYTGLLQRAVTLKDCLRLAIVCCMPGELVIAAGMFVYGMQRISIAELVVVFALHVIVVAAYLLITPLWLPGRESVPETTYLKHPGSSRKNPFAAPPPGG